MNGPNKMIVAVGALALTATTLLAGCGGGSTEATLAAEPAAAEPAAAEPAAAEPAAAEPAAAEAPDSIFEGTVKPADISDGDWNSIVMVVDERNLQEMATATPELFATACANGFGTDPAATAQDSLAYGGTLEEWTQVWETVFRNMVLMACSMAE